MNRFGSIFSQLLHLFPPADFWEAMRKTNAERHAQGFPCWGQFVAVLFCQLGRAHSLREITGGLRSCEGQLKHLGITAPSHSTLVYANALRVNSRTPPRKLQILSWPFICASDQSLVKSIVPFLLGTPIMAIFTFFGTVSIR